MSEPNPTVEGTSLRSTPEAEAARRKARESNQKRGLVLVHTGKGKGKTTAALGLLMRAWGRDMRVGGVQFLKNQHAQFGEIRAAERMGIDLRPMGDGFTWTSRDLDETRAKVLHGWDAAQQRITSGEYDVFLLDECTYVMHFGWLDAADVVTWLRENKPAALHLVITGRDAPVALIEFADLVTEMTLVKHPLRDQGIRTQPGVEF